jgi:quercetin dioxygenase-like cupin family protein
LILASAVVFASLSHFAHAADSQAKSWQQGLSRSDLIRQDLGTADREVIQARIDFDAGVAAPRHAHPGVEVAYVISGLFEYQLEGQAPVTLKAGDSRQVSPMWRKTSAAKRARNWRLTSSRRANRC